MTTIRTYTTIEQSRKLAELLPVESADVFYSVGNETQPTFRLHSYGHIMSDKDVCAWSLAALLSVLPSPLHLNKRENINGIVYWCNDTDDYDNPVDACYELILKLNELNLL